MHQGSEKNKTKKTSTRNLSNKLVNVNRYPFNQLNVVKGEYAHMMINYAVLTMTGERSIKYKSC